MHRAGLRALSSAAANPTLAGTRGIGAEERTWTTHRPRVSANVSRALSKRVSLYNGAVHGQPAPIDALRLVIGHQTSFPHALKYAGAYPFCTHS